MGSLSDQGYFSRMQHIIQYRPTIGLGNDQDLLTSDIDPLLQDDSGNTMVNPIASIEGEQREKRNRYLTLNGGLEYKLLPSLIYNGSIGYRTRATNPSFPGSSPRHCYTITSEPSATLKVATTLFFS